MCVLWTIQTCVPGQGGIYLYLFPVNCILIAIKVIRNLLGQWQEQHEQMGENARETDRGRMPCFRIQGTGPGWHSCSCFLCWESWSWS